jgi:hypothetical protein
MGRLIPYWPKHKPYLYKLMFGLIATAVIPTVITVYVLYSHYMESMLHEVGSSNKRLLEQSRMNGDMLMGEMLNTVSMLMGNPQISMFMRAEYTTDSKSFNNEMDDLRWYDLYMKHDGKSFYLEQLQPYVYSNHGVYKQPDRIIKRSHK